MTDSAANIIARVRNHKPRRCCANCEHMDADTGYCHKVKDSPPLEYLTQTTDCEHWLDWIPF